MVVKMAPCESDKNTKSVLPLQSTDLTKKQFLIINLLLALLSVRACLLGFGFLRVAGPMFLIMLGPPLWGWPDSDDEPAQLFPTEGRDHGTHGH